jgi:hypothetical protein
MFTLSPFFPLFLSFILFIIYKFNCDLVILCDDGSPPLLLGQLQNNLTAEINKTSKITSEIIEFNKTIDNSILTEAQKLDNNRTSRFLKEMLLTSLKRSNEIEASIRKIDPNFTSGLFDVNAHTIRTVEAAIRR